MKLIIFISIGFIIFTESKPLTKRIPEVSNNSVFDKNLPTEGEDMIDANLEAIENSKKWNKGFLHALLGFVRTKRSYALQSVSTSRSGE